MVYGEGWDHIWDIVGRTPPEVIGERCSGEGVRYNEIEEALFQRTKIAIGDPMDLTAWAWTCTVKLRDGRFCYVIAISNSDGLKVSCYVCAELDAMIDWLIFDRNTKIGLITIQNMSIERQSKLVKDAKKYLANPGEILN